MDWSGQTGPRGRRCALVLAVALASAPGTGRAAETAEEPDAGAPEAPAATVYATATVRERPVASATAAVTVIDREAIEALGARTVADVLAFVPGVTLETAGTRGGLTTARIRGGDPNYTLVLLDGVPLNDGTYPVGEVFDLEALPAGAVERIEIVRGPLSAFYGSTGLAGAIHVITRSGRHGGLRGEAEAAAGDAHHRRLGAELGGALPAAGGAGGYFLRLGHDEEAERIAEERFALDHLQGRLDLPLGDGVELRIAGRAAGWEADDYPEASGGPVLGSGELRRGEHDEASLGAELTVRGRNDRLHKLTAAFYRHAMDRTSPAVPPLVPPSVEATRFTRGRLGWASSFGPAPGWTVNLGADLAHERGDNESALLLPPAFGGAVPGDYSLSRTTGGAYTEVIAERGPVVVELGLRGDLPEGASGQVSPRLGVSWRPGDGRTRLRASAGRAFKLPSFFALASPPALGGNPDLEPEVMVGGDVGVERTFGAAGSASLTLFTHRFENLVDFDFETFSHVNRAEVEARGAEATLGWRLRPGLALAADVTWQDVEDAGTGEPLRQRPRWSGGARLAWRPLPRLDLHLDGRFVSSFRDEQIPAPDRREVAGRELLGLGATWRAGRAWRLEARVDNVTDEAYETLIGFPGAGRSAWVGVGRRFGGTGDPEEGAP